MHTKRRIEFALRGRCAKKPSRAMIAHDLNELFKP